MLSGVKHTSGHGHGHGHGHTPAHGAKHVKRHRKSRAFAVVAVAGLAASAILVTWSSLRRENEAYLTKEVNSGFDVQEVSSRAEAAIAAAARPAPPAPPPSAPPSSLVAPIMTEHMAASAPSASAVPESSPLAARKAERWVRTHKVFAAFLKAPARLLAKRSSNLASPRALKAFLADPKRVNAYLDAPLVRAALNSPTVTKTLLTDPGVVKAFLSTPAMQDESAVRALLSSKLFRKVMDCPGPQGAFEDPAVITRMVTNPVTVRWIGENPQALTAIAKAAPAMASAFAARPKTRR